MSSVSAAKPFVKRACLTKQFHSPAYFHRVGRPGRVMCTGRSNARLLKEIRQVSKDVQALSTNVIEVRTELKVRRLASRLPSSSTSGPALPLCWALQP